VGGARTPTGALQAQAPLGAHPPLPGAGIAQRAAAPPLLGVASAAAAPGGLCACRQGRSWGQGSRKSKHEDAHFKVTVAQSWPGVCMLLGVIPARACTPALMSYPSMDPVSACATMQRLTHEDMHRHRHRRFQVPDTRTCLPDPQLRTKCHQTTCAACLHVQPYQLKPAAAAAHARPPLR